MARPSPIVLLVLLALLVSACGPAFVGDLGDASPDALGVDDGAYPVPGAYTDDGSFSSYPTPGAGYGVSDPAAGGSVDAGAPGSTGDGG